MKTKFFITSVSIDSSASAFDDRFYLGCGDNKCNSITVSMRVIPFDRQRGDLLSCISCGKLVTITDYEDYVEPFKDEFKEFLLKYYPEKVISGQKEFNHFFGES